MQKCTERMVAEFRYLRTQAVEPLATFLDYITCADAVRSLRASPSRTCPPVFSSYGYMIDNIVLLLTGTLHERDTHELLEKCHPLGMFESMATLCVATNTQELYNSVLIDTPLGALPPPFSVMPSAHASHHRSAVLYVVPQRGGPRRDAH